MPSRPRTPATPADAGEVPFEQAMEELEEIIHSLDGGTQDLDALVVQYEKGMKLLAGCRQQLDTAQLRIEQITRRADGSAEITPLTPVPPGPAPVAAPAPSSPPSSSDDDIRLF